MNHEKINGLILFFNLCIPDRLFDWIFCCNLLVVSRQTEAIDCMLCGDSFPDIPGTSLQGVAHSWDVFSTI